MRKGAYNINIHFIDSKQANKRGNRKGYCIRHTQGCCGEEMSRSDILSLCDVVSEITVSIELIVRYSEATVAILELLES